MTLDLKSASIARLRRMAPTPIEKLVAYTDRETNERSEKSRRVFMKPRSYKDETMAVLIPG